MDKSWGMRDPLRHALLEIGVPLDQFPAEGEEGQFIDQLDLNPDRMMDLMIALDQLKRRYKVLGEITAELKERLAKGVVEYFEDNEKDKEPRRGRTIYRATERWPKILGSKDRLVAAMRADPTTNHLVNENFNTNSLRSFLLKDCLAFDEQTGEERIEIPEHLEGLLGVSEVVKIKVLKGSK